MVKEIQSDITKFLLESNNTVIREELFNYKLFYDLKLAAAKQMRYIKIYRPEVDIEGCDIIVEDGTDFARKIQVKTKVSKNTSSWNIHKWLLLPGYNQMEDYGFTATLCPSTPGGFLVIDVLENNNGEIETSYRFIDIHILLMLVHGYIDKGAKAKADATAIFRQLAGYGQKHIKIKKNLMLKIKNADSLLKMCGFLQQYEFVNNVQKICQTIYTRTRHFGDSSLRDNHEEYLRVLEKRVSETIQVSKRQLDQILSDCVIN